MGEGHRLTTEPGGRRRRWQLAVVAGVLVAIVAVVGAVLTVVNHDPDTGPALGQPSAVRTPPPTEATPSGGPKPPAKGAYLGAYVQPPSDYTEQGRIDAVTAFEEQTGRQLDIVHTYHPWDDEFPDKVDNWAIDNDRMLLLSWAGTDTRVIQSGRYDDMIRQRARAVRAMDTPIFLQWRWEMDRPNLRASVWSAPDYIAAWRHIRKIFAEEKTDNVSWVWCPTAAGFTENRAAPFYPGDSDVDWICADVYSGQEWDDFGTAAKAFLDWAKGHPDKPIMIGEWATSDQYPRGQNGWLEEAAAVTRANPSIKALVYFNGNDRTKGPRAQLVLKDAAVGGFGKLLADPYFNTRRLPVGR